MTTTPQPSPRLAGEAVKAFREYLTVHALACTGMDGHAIDDMALDLAHIALDFQAATPARLHQICEPAAPAQPETGLNWIATIDVFDGEMEDMELVPPRITLPDGSHRLYALPVTQGGA